MEKIIELILHCSVDDKLEHLQTELNKLSDAFQKNKDKFAPEQWQEGLSMLDAQAHTLGALHILHIICSLPKYDKANFIEGVRILIGNGTARQLKIDPKRFAFVCRRFTECCRDLRIPMRAIRYLQEAKRKVAPSENHLTPQHVHILLACISSKAYKAALPMLDHFVYLIDPTQTGLSSEDTRLYYYYGGICYAALKKWEKAIQFFEILISAPAIIASAIMIEGYKKYLMSSLIHKGETSSLPNCINSTVIRQFKQSCAPYEDLVQAFKNVSLEQFNAVFEANIQVFSKDNNLGFVGQVKTAMGNQQIKRLRNVYSTISLDQLLAETEMESSVQLEARLMRMVSDSRDFQLSIDQQNGYLKYVYSDFAFNDDAAMNYLSEHIHSILHIHRQIASVDRMIEKDERCVKKTFKNELQMEAMGPRGGGMQVEAGFYAMDEDDLMMYQ